MKEEERRAGGWQEVQANRLLSTEEAADVLNTSARTVNDMINAGLLVPVYYGKKRCLPVSILNTFIAEHVGRDVLEEIKAVGASR